MGKVGHDCSSWVIICISLIKGVSSMGKVGHACSSWVIICISYQGGLHYGQGGACLFILGHHLYLIKGVSSLGKVGHESRLNLGAWVIICISLIKRVSSMGKVGHACSSWVIICISYQGGLHYGQGGA